MQYPEDGYLPEALFNYLARLGWSHGDAEKFTREQFVEWFDLAHVSKSTAQFDAAKLAWLNHEYIKEADDGRLAGLLAPRVERDGGRLADGPALVEVVKLLKDRATTLEHMAESAMMFYKRMEPSKALVAEHLTPEVMPAVRALAGSLERVEWQRPQLNEAVKAVVGKFGHKMPQDRHAAAHHAARADADAVDRCGARAARPRHRARAAPTLSCGKLIRLYRGGRKPV